MNELHVHSIVGVNKFFKNPFKTLQKKMFHKDTYRNSTTNLDIAWALSTQDLNIP
jgi:hypothetical protein